MSLLLILPDDDPARAVRRSRDAAEIASALAPRGVRFEQWQAEQPLSPDAGQDEVIRAYRADIDRLVQACGYRSVDVVRLRPDDADPGWPAKAEAARKKFLEEHRHAEDEVRFFVEGAGLFYLRIDGLVHCVLCERGDLIGVPAGTRHWFDMGARPLFTAIRVFTSPEGWVARFTGDPIARSFPTFDDLARDVA